MEFLPADPDKIRKLLEGRESVLEERLKEDERYYASKTCPECNASCFAVLDEKQPFTSGRLTPKCLLHCTSCKTIFEPDTGVIVKTGEAYRPVPTATDIFVRND